MNLKELREQTRFKSNITDTSTLTNAEIDQLVNDAQFKLVMRIIRISEDFFEEQKTTFNLAANSGLYQLPTDLIKFKQLRLAYSTPSDDSDYFIATGYNPSDIQYPQNEESGVGTSNPIIDITNNYMRIRPKPTTDVTKGGQIYYIARPSALANTGDISVIPEDYHDLMAIYAAGKACEKYEVWDRADRFEAQFFRGAETMAKELATRELNHSVRFKNPLEIGKKLPTRELY
ncbi:MAG: phage adaptor protein [Candidatus Heimdallarchaeota archaeon]